MYKKTYYSQDGEDVVLSSFYDGKPVYKGFYIDIGALHPLKFSNTQYFYEKGWCGINIDATPGSMIEFDRFRSRDINIEAGISYTNQELVFYSFKEPAMNSFSKKLSEDRIKNGWELLNKIKVKTFSINEILSRHLPKGQKVDFINIDIEGLELEVVKSLDWKKYTPDFLLIEELNIIEKDIIGYEKCVMYQFLKKMDYSIVARTRRTLIYKKC